MHCDWLSVVTAIATSVAAGTAVWATVLTNRSLKLQNEIAERENSRALLASGLDLLLREDREFNTEKFVASRKKASDALLHPEAHKESDVDEVLDFFDQVGFLVRRGAIDPEMAWHSFQYWLNRYWVAAEPYINRKRKEARSAWADLAILRQQLLVIEKANDPESEELNLTKDSSEIKRFLIEEGAAIPWKDWVG